MNETVGTMSFISPKDNDPILQFFKHLSKLNFLECRNLV
jgi:hypothetical protein